MKAPIRLRAWWFGAAAAIAMVALAAGMGFDLSSAARSIAAGDGRNLLTAKDREGARRSLGYGVEVDRPIRFDLPAGVSQIRFVTNADLKPGVDLGRISQPEEGWRYAFDLRATDSRGNELWQRRYHFRSRATRAMRAPSIDSNEPSHAPFFSSYIRGPQPLDARMARIRHDSGSSRRSTQLEVVLKEVDPILGSATVRLYLRQNVPGIHRHAQWPMLSVRERDRLAEGNVYPHDLLTEAERYVLVSHRWTPTAPRGVAGRDYQRRTLLQLSDLGTGAPRQEIRLFGLPLLEGMRSAIRLGNRARLSVVLTPPDLDQSAHPEDAVLHWLDAEGRTLRQAVLRLEAGSLSFVSSKRGEFLEVLANRPLILRSFTADAAAGSLGELEEEIAPSVEALRAYSCGSAPIVFRVLHPGGAATPVRVDLRSIGNSAGNGNTSDSDREQSLRYRLLRADGSVLDTGTLVHRTELSAFDWADHPENGQQRLSEPTRNYFEVPPEAVHLSLDSCSSELLIAGYNRPDGLPWQQRVPPLEGSDPPNRWFALRPTASPHSAAYPSSVLLHFQERPPNPSSRLSTEDYRVQSYQPDDWTGRQLLLKRTLPPNRQALASTFVPIPDGRPITIRLASTGAEQMVRPTLLFRRASRSPFRAQVRIGEGIELTEERAGRQGEITLPPLPPGEHRFQIAATGSDSDRGDLDGSDPNGEDGTEWYLSHALTEAGAPDQVSYARRWAFHLSSGGSFEIEIDKPSASPVLVTGRLYWPVSGVTGSPGAHACEVSLTVSGRRRETGPLGEWSFLKRTYQVNADRSDRVAALGDDTLWAYRSPAFFTRLGSDLPAGRYRMRATTSCADQQGEVLATLSRLAEPEAKEGRFFIERSSL